MKTKGVKIFILGVCVFLVGAFGFYFSSKLPGAIPLFSKEFLVLLLTALVIFVALKPATEVLIDRYYKK